MNQSSKKRFALLGAAAMGMATLGLSSTAAAHETYHPYPDFSYGGYTGYPMTRHEQQHDSNQNGRLDPWEHESLHQHEAQSTTPAYPYYRQRPVRRVYRTRPAWSWSWSVGW